MKNVVCRVGSREVLSHNPLLLVCINLARLSFNQLLNQTLMWVLLWLYVTDVIVCNQSMLSNEITFNSLGGPDSISCKVLRAGLRLPWRRRNSTHGEECSFSSGLPFLMTALWLGDLPGQLPQSYIIRFFVINQSILPTGSVSATEPWLITHYETFYPKILKGSWWFYMYVCVCVYISQIYMYIHTYMHTQYRLKQYEIPVLPNK